jgi:PAS domain S-box-containing protein
VYVSAPSQSALQAETEARLRFELLLADVCAQFVSVAASDVDSKIENAQRVMCESLRMDQSSVWQVSEENPDLLVMTHVYRDPNLKPLPLRPNAKEYFPWGYNKVLNKEIVCVPNTAILPAEAAKDKDSWEQYGIHSSLVFPLSVGGGSVIGVLAFDSEKEHDWPEPLQRRLQILAHVFAQALDRKNAVRNVKMGQEALRGSEERLRLAQQAARIGSFEWNIRTGAESWTPELEAVYGLPPGGFGGTHSGWINLIHEDDLAEVQRLTDETLKTGRPMTGEWRVVWPDGSIHWIAGRWQVSMDQYGKPWRVLGVNIDVTERKRAEQELSEANERLRLALEAGSAGGWDYDLKTGKNVWFGTAHEQLGMTPDETSGSRKEFWDRIHEDDRDRVEHALQVAKEKREVYAEDVRVVWRDGTTHWLRSRGRFQYDANGEAERSLGISLDITERKMAEERLREYERAVEGSEEMIAVVDRRYRYLIANNQFLKMRNATREQVVGRFAYEVLDEGFFETVAKPKLDECFQGRVVKYETKYSYPETGERDLFISYFPIEGDSGIDRVACIMHDITDRKRAEDALVELNRSLEAQTALLQSSEELLKIFVKNVPVAVAMLDHELRYLQVSDRWCSDNAVEAQELLGRPREALPEMPERWKEVNRRALQGETLRADEDSWESAGSTRWARWEVRPWRKPDGNVGGILVFAEDITHRKQMEETLSGMTRKLIEAQEQERARIGRELHDDINQRLAMLAVELEQPLDPSEFPNRVQGFREELRQISDDVQALSHDLHSTKLEYLGVVAGMKSWCKEFAQRQKMDVDFKSDLRSVLPLDIGRPLFRVLQEALQNSFKHSGVKRIEVRLREGSGEIQLTISDLGKGFDLEAALRGKGLGLTSMRERVRLVKGTISIESKPIGGTTVHVRIPLAPEHGSQRAAG